MGQTGPFVTQLDPSLAGKLQRDLEERGFTLSQPPYTLFSGKKKGVSCTLYQSGKLVVQGKEKGEFIEFYLEPELLGSFTYTHPEKKEVDLTGCIGVDESGKGDYFGPLCIASFFAEGEGIQELIQLGVQDSKTLNDEKILKLAPKLRARYPHHIIRIGPEKYNELHPKFGSNLNRLLAWGHATAIEQLHQKTQCPRATIDQFAAEHVVEQALRQKGVSIELTQRTKAEELPVVAAASILAREAYLLGMQALEKEFDLSLPKGASKKVIQAGRAFVQRHGERALRCVAKLHFRTTETVLGGVL